MAIYYSPNPSVTQPVLTAPYSTATSDIYVSATSGTKKLTKSAGLTWSNYTPSTSDNGFATPNIPGLVDKATPIIPFLTVAAVSPTITVTQNQSISSTTVITVYGGSAVATNYYASTGTFVGYTTTIDKALPAGVTWTSTFATVKLQNVTDNKYYLYNGATITINGTPTVPVATTNYTISFTDASGLTANASFSLTVNSNQTPLTATSAVTGNKILTQGVSAGVGGFATVTASGGSSPLTYSVSPTLPTGLTFNTSTGYISGTPTVALSNTTFTVTVTDKSASPKIANTTFNMSVSANIPAATLAVPTTILTQNIVFTAFAPVTGSGGTAPLRYDVSPTLPSGLTFSTSTGIISGTPSASVAAANYNVTVTDSLQQYDSKSFNLTVKSIPALSYVQTAPSYSLYRSVAVAPFTPITANGGYNTVTYSITPTPPSGLTFSTSTGLISGTPSVTSSTATYVVNLTDQASQTSSGTFSLAVLSIPLSVAQQVPSTLFTKNVTGSGFTPVTASGGYSPYTYGVSPSLPSGLTFNTSTGYVSGTSTVASNATSYLVTVTDSAAQSGTSSFSLTVLQPAAIVLTKSVNSLTLVQDVAVTAFTPVSATGGYGNLTYTISPTLTTGLIINASTGQITGKPTTYSVNTTTYTISVADQAAQISSSTFNMNVLTPPFSVVSSVPSTDLVTGVTVTAFTPVTASGGATPYSYSLNTSLSAGLSFSTSTGRVSGTPTVGNTSNYIVTITDTVGQSGTGSFVLNIATPPALVLTTAIPTTTLVKSVDTANFIPVTASGGYGSISLSIYPPLPGGLSFSAIGKISGVSTQTSAQTSYTVKGIDSIGQLSSSTFSLTVNNPALASTATISISTLTQYTAVTPYTPVTYVGGTPPVVYSIAPSLSSGLSLNTSTGVISGTPATSLSTTSYNITITDSIGGQTTSTTRINISAISNLVSTRAVSTVTAYAGLALDITPVTASGGYGSNSYSVSPSLPSALTLGSLDGKITGSSSQLSATATYTVTVTNPVSQTTSTTFDLTVKAKPVVATSSVPFSTLIVYQQSTPFAPITGSGGFGSLSYASNLSLPSGLSLNTSTGYVSGTPTALSDTATYIITVTDSISQSSTSSFVLSVAEAEPTPLNVTVSSAALSFTQNQSTSISPVQVLGGVSPYTYSLTPSLPAGLTFSTSTGIITGSPSAISSATTYNITVSDSQPKSITKSFSLTVIASTVTGSGSVNQINNTSNATSTNSGALVVAGGAGIGGNLYAGGLYDDGNRVVTNVNPSGSNYIGISSLISTGTQTSFTIVNLGVQTLTAGTDTTVSSSTGTITIWNSSTLQTVTDRGHTTTNAINITNNTTSTGATSGALVVSGGVGIGGDVFIGGTISINGIAVGFGYTGSLGYTGSAGYVGSQGIEGYIGSVGYTGSSGIAGYDGSSGYTGSIGAQGDIGYTGSFGAQGYTGSFGTQGFQGDIGYTGSFGTQGFQGDTGYTGSFGTQGFQGDTGYTGSFGAQGFQGDTGYTGSFGAQGFQGDTGYTGSYGAQGYTGSYGSQGFQGDTGYTGSFGVQGFQGFQGDTGLGFTIAKTYASVASLTADTAPTGIVAGQFAIINTSDVENSEDSRLYLWNGSTYTYVTDLSGAQGIKGETGYTGSIGDTGYTGSFGTQGYQGYQGDIGYTGSFGAQGYQGFQGDTGYTGSFGAQGFQGDTGYTGSFGTQGFQGDIGYTGSYGAQGDTGYTGSFGTQGFQGDTGYTGSYGTQGDTGYTGSFGTQGFQGDTGYTGSYGAQGDTGYTGSFGTQGFQGDIGYTGSYGAQGDTGYTGSFGTQGFQGDIGYTGSYGDTGYTGSYGAQGAQGDTGLGFTIAKTYASVAALTADTSPTGIVAGQFAIIDTGDVENSEDSRLYLWNGTTYTYVTDLSGAQGIKGETGYTGSYGDTGYVGSRGDTGYTGSYGDTGYTGSYGDTGYTGSYGDTGYTGSYGDTGYTGSYGDTGYTGSYGDTGYTGSYGDTGYTGSYGDTGYTGSYGDTGYTGSYGDTGYTGSYGDTGYTGSYGDTGYTGSYGDTGYTGSYGDTGYTGSYGDTGYTGSYGDTGYTGSYGDTGYTGSYGDTGYTGSYGDTGYTGSYGDTGYTGSYGDTGYTGSYGDTGYTGSYGDTGYTGSYGDTGYTGSYGDTGYTGSYGDTGYTGSYGDTGYTGSYGDTGYTGSYGDTGYTGSYGDTGYTGSYGDTGYTGSYGDTGYTGSYGDTGYTGSYGDTGYTGSYGDTGYTGSYGDTGYTGSYGDTGYTGSYGDTGYTGSYGDTGYTGSYGDTGYTGSYGDTGYVGSQGDIGYTGSFGDIGYTGSLGSFTGTTEMVVNITNITLSTSTDTGALIVAGGVGIGGDLYAGNIFSNGIEVITTTTLASGTSGNSDNVFVNLVTPSTSYYVGLTELTGDYSPIDSDSLLTYDTIDNKLTTTKLSVSGTTNSTSTDTGALIVAGGAGIGGDVNIGGNIQIVNTSYIGGAQIITTATIGNYAAAGPSITSSSTPPTNPNVGDFWYVADLGILSVYKLDQGEYYWLDITGRTVLTSVQPQDGPVDFMMWSLLNY